MSIDLDLSREETFQSVLDYFAGKHAKILSSKHPSLVRVEFGALISMIEVANARCTAEATITKKEGGSCVSFKFDFSKFYVASILGIALMGLVVLSVFYWMTDIVLAGYSSQVAGEAMTTLYPLGIVLIGLYFALSISLETYSARRTRKKVLEEFAELAHPSQTTKPT